MGYFFHVHCSIKINQQYYPFKKIHHYLSSNTTIFAMSWKQRPPKCWVSSWLTFLPADWVTVWSGDWLTDWLADMLTDVLTDLLTNLLINWLADWLNYWRAVLLKLIDWQSHTNQLIMIAGSLTNWLYWLADKLRFMLRKESRLLIANEDGQFFILDRMWPADVLRLQQPGFWAYLQYCKCCTHCFVI